VPIFIVAQGHPFRLPASEPPVEYRLFNLSLQLPRSFRAESVHQNRVLFTLAPGQNQKKNDLVVDLSYFPADMSGVGPKSLSQFVAQVWPELDQAAKTGNAHSGTVRIKIFTREAGSPYCGQTGKAASFCRNSDAAKAMLPLLRADLVSFSLFQTAQKNDIYLLFIKSGERRYFLQISLNSAKKGIWEPLILEALSGMKFVYLPEDQFRVTQILRMFNQKNISSNRNKILLHDQLPFFYQGHPQNAKEWLQHFAGYQDRGRKWILLEQDDLSQKSFSGIAEPEMHLLKSNLHPFVRLFASGDIVAYSAAGDDIQRHVWYYFLFRKTEVGWVVYAIGHGLPASGHPFQDKPEKIIW